MVCPYTTISDGKYSLLSLLTMFCAMLEEQGCPYIRSVTTSAALCGFYAAWFRGEADALPRYGTYRPVFLIYLCVS